MTPGANDLCVFAVKRGNTKKRFDVDYCLHGKLIKLNSTYTIVKFGELIEDIYRYPTFYNIKYVSNGIGVIKGENIARSGEWVKINDLGFIDKETNNRFLRTVLQKNDLVMTVRGEVGKTGLVTEQLAGCNISGNVIKIRLKKYWNDVEIAPNYVWEYLNSALGKALIKKQISGGVQETITVADISDIDIILPDTLLQEELARDIGQKRVYINKKLNHANGLLLGHTNMVLDRLGLCFDREGQVLCHSIRLCDITARLDVDYYTPKFESFRKQIERSFYPSTEIGAICNRIVTGFAAGKQDQADDLPDDQRVAQLRPFSITPEGELSFETKKYVPKDRLKSEDYCQKGEVIFNNTNSPDLVGKTTVFDQDVLCATSNHMTRITVKDGVNPYYVAAFFNVLLSIGYWKLLCTNFNNQAGINIETLKKVRIPLPDKSIQDEIAAEIMRRRSQANELRKEAAKEWAEAKAQFEKELLGE